MTAGASGARRGALLRGASAGCLALGIDALAHGVLAVPLLPEQAGFAFLRVLPLAAFSVLLRAFGPLARPLLLVGATLGVITAFALAAVALEWALPRLRVPVLTLLSAAATATVALMAAAPGDSVSGTVLEVALVAATVPLVYGAQAWLASGRASEDEDRRLVLRNLFYGGVALAAAGIAYVDLRRLVEALAMRESSRPTTEITPVRDFYVVSKNLSGDPVLNAGGWRLVLPARSLSYAELMAVPKRRVELTLSCISNEVGGTLISNGIWEGPAVQDVLAGAGVAPDAAYLLIESADGYTESLPLSELTPDHLLATHLNGRPLTSEHGFPVRCIFPGHYGMKQPKWVTRLKLSSRDERGYWEQRGWDERAIVKTMSRIDAPPEGAEMRAGSVAFSGIAFAGTRRIDAVELSWDGGRRWNAATLDPEFSPFAWRFWRLDASLSSGRYIVRVRARDGTGALQSAGPVPTLPNGAEGWHAVRIDVR